MSDETKDKKQEETKEETLDLNTAYGRFQSEVEDPKSPAYFIEGLLAQTHPNLKKQLHGDFKKMFEVVDVFNGLMKEIMSTPQGRREFNKELTKFEQRRKANELAKGGSSDDPENT